MFLLRSWRLKWHLERRFHWKFCRIYLEEIWFRSVLTVGPAADFRAWILRSDRARTLRTGGVSVMWFWRTPTSDDRGHQHTAERVWCFYGRAQLINPAAQDAVHVQQHELWRSGWTRTSWSLCWKQLLQSFSRNISDPAGTSQIQQEHLRSSCFQQEHLRSSRNISDPAVSFNGLESKTWNKTVQEQRDHEKRKGKLRTEGKQKRVSVWIRSFICPLSVFQTSATLISSSDWVCAISGYFTTFFYKI